MEFYHHTPAEAFVATCKLINAADEVSPRGMPTREHLNVTLHIDDPMAVPFDVAGRNLNPQIAALELIQLIAQTPADALVRRKNRSLAAFQDNGISYGNYGARLRGQLASVVSLLVNDPDTRQAVMTIYDGPTDLGHVTKDIPCTLSVQFFVRSGMLHTRVNMRSNDVWLGLPYDLQQFCALHCAMAEILDIDVGRYTHSVGSMHLYERHWDCVDELGETLSSPQLAFFKFYRSHPMGRLAELVQNMQDILIHDYAPATNFEKWLVDVIDE